MVLIKLGHPDVGADISREVEYQAKRGFVASYIEVSPESMEAMRLQMRAPAGAMLTEHDGIPVVLNKKFIGAKAWRVHYDKPAPPTEKLVDRAKFLGKL